MFAVNKFDVANKLLKAFPYIGEIKIRRRLPDTFTFEVTERKRAAFFQHEKFRWLADKNGYILEGLPPQQEVAVPQVVGITLMAPTPGTKVALPEDEMFYSLTALLTALEDGGLIEKTKQVDISKLYNLTVTYDNRFLIELGSTEELYEKIRMLNAVFGQLEPMDKGVINVSDPKQARFRPDANVNLNLVKATDVKPEAEPTQNAEGSGAKPAQPDGGEEEKTGAENQNADEKAEASAEDNETEPSAETTEEKE